VPDAILQGTVRRLLIAVTNQEIDDIRMTEIEVSNGRQNKTESDRNTIGREIIIQVTEVAIILPATIVNPNTNHSNQ
jgi:hypothetical protein